jgi:starvation-inducible DNA-binding protein
MSNRANQLHVVNSDHLLATKNQLPLDVRHASIEYLNAIVVQMIDVALAAKHAHWNVRGPNFISYHKLFDKVFTDLIANIDTVGERITALGGIARGTVQTIANGTELQAYPVLAVAEREHIEQLSSRLGILGRKVREAAREADKHADVVTEDVLIESAATIDGLLWVIESHIARS